MTLIEWTILAFVVGVILIIAEVALPTHGILGILGLGGILAAIVLCFAINLYLGLASVVVLGSATPLAWAWMVKVWPSTRFGRRLVLPLPEPHSNEPPVAQIGQKGRAVSELRPVGVCEFDGKRIESQSLGIIPAGHEVIVVDVVNRRPTVKAL